MDHLVQGKSDRQILVIIKNYTGDLINFKMACVATQAKYADKNVRIKILEVGDDIALLDSDTKMLPRGVAGTALLYKVLGAAAKQG